MPPKPKSLEKLLAAYGKSNGSMRAIQILSDALRGRTVLYQGVPRVINSVEDFPKKGPSVYLDGDPEVVVSLYRIEEEGGQLRTKTSSAVIQRISELVDQTK